MASTGTVIQVIGSTFDAQFPEGDMPAIYNAVECTITAGGESLTLVGEVARHLGGGQVRCVALASTDGLRRGDACRDTGAPVSVPVGEKVLGRVFNLLGEPIDERGPVEGVERRCRPLRLSPPHANSTFPSPTTLISSTGSPLISEWLSPSVASSRPHSSIASRW